MEGMHTRLVAVLLGKGKGALEMGMGMWNNCFFFLLYSNAGWYCLIGTCYYIEGMLIEYPC